MALRSHRQHTFRPDANPMPTDVLRMGEARTEAMLAMQKDLVNVFEKISRTWAARIKSEADLWSEFATKISTAGSPPNALEACQHCMTLRMQMAAEDGRQLLDDSQQIMGAITRAMTNGRTARTT